VSLIKYLQPIWIKSLIGEISSDIFYNDIDVVKLYDIEPNMFENDFTKLKNIPSLNSHISQEVRNKYANRESNLSDSALENIKTKFNLSYYSYCNIEENFEIENMKYENIKMDGVYLPKTGILTPTNDVLYLDNIFFATSYLYGKSKFINSQDVNIEALLPTSLYMSNYIERIFTNIESKQGEVRQYIGGILLYLEKYKNIFSRKQLKLNDVNEQAARRNLNLSSFYGAVSISETTLEVKRIKIEIFQRKSKLNLKNVKDLESISSFGYLYYDDKNTYHHIQREQFNRASKATEGTCKIEVYILANIDENESKTFNKLIYRYNYNLNIEKINKLLDDIILVYNQVIDTKQTLNEKDKLLRIANNLDELEIVEEFSGIYQTLGIDKVAYTKDYNDLSIKQRYISGFENDVLYLKAVNNFVDIESEEMKSKARDVLLIGSLGIQNIDNVNMMGDVFNMDFLKISSSLKIQNDIDENDNIFLTVNGWHSLYEYDIENQEQYGIVMLNTELIMNNGYIDVYLSVNSDENTVYSTMVLNEFERKMNYELDKLYAEIVKLRKR
jgi:hypothetical protein